MLAFAPQKVIIYRLCGLLSLLLFASHGWAGLPVRNQSPVAIYVGLPELKSAEKLDNGEQIISLNTTYNSHFIDKTNQPQPLFFDGESSVGDFFWRRGMLDWEWEIILPYISYQKGFMDSFVIKWHKAFGLPNANRSKFPKEKLVMSYDGLLLDHHTHGMGDMRITLGKQLLEQVNSHHAIHITLKLPTGDVDDWLGSGSTDLGVFSTHRWQQETLQEELQFGLLGMETPELLPSQRRKVAAFMSAALTYSLSDSWDAIVQYDAHTALYNNSQLTALQDGQIISVGSRWAFDTWSLHFALLEDFRVYSSPDVGFQLGVEFGPRD